MKEKILEFLTKLLSKDFVNRLSAFILQLAQDTAPPEQKKQMAVDFGCKVIDELEAAAIAKLPSGFPQWVATQFAKMADGFERQWVDAQVEVIWRAMKLQVVWMQNNVDLAAKILGGTVVENRIVLPMHVVEREAAPMPPGVTPGDLTVSRKDLE